MKINYDNIVDQQNLFRNFIEGCKLAWSSLINIHQKIDYDAKFNKLRIDNNNLKIKIAELDAKLLISNNSNMIYKENTHNIISRFLANELIISLLIKYPEKLDKISLNLSIFIDLIAKSQYNILSNNEIIDFILGISTNLNKDLEEYRKASDESVKKNLKENIVKYLSPYQKIKFIDDIKIDGETFKKKN